MKKRRGSKQQTAKSKIMLKKNLQFKMSDYSDVDKWIEIAKQCKYLPENDLKVSNIYIR